MAEADIIAGSRLKTLVKVMNHPVINGLLRTAFPTNEMMVGMGGIFIGKMAIRLK